MLRLEAGAAAAVLFPPALPPLGAAVPVFVAGSLGGTGQTVAHPKPLPLPPFAPPPPPLSPYGVPAEPAPVASSTGCARPNSSSRAAAPGMGRGSRRLYAVESSTPPLRRVLRTTRRRDPTVGAGWLEPAFRRPPRPAVRSQRLRSGRRPCAVDTSMAPTPASRPGRRRRASPRRRWRPLAGLRWTGRIGGQLRGVPSARRRGSRASVGRVPAYRRTRRAHLRGRGPEGHQGREQGRAQPRGTTSDHWAPRTRRRLCGPGLDEDG